MAVQDHPLYDEWDKAFTELKDAHEYYLNALKTDAVSLELTKRDWAAAQKKYNDIADRIE